MKRREIQEKLADWRRSVHSDQEMLVELIFESVNLHKIERLDALKFISEYKLLPIASCVQHIDFMDKYMYSGNIDRYQIVDFYDSVFFNKSDFLDPDTNTAYTYARFPSVCYEEAINIVYDYVKEHRIIGFENDW